MLLSRTAGYPQKVSEAHHKSRPMIGETVRLTMKNGRIVCPSISEWQVSIKVFAPCHLSIWRVNSSRSSGRYRFRRHANGKMDPFLATPNRIQRTLDISVSINFENARYDDVIMGAIAPLITSLTIVYSTVYSDADQRKHQSSASLAFVWGIHRGPVNSPYKWPITRKMFPFDDVIIHSRQPRSPCWRWCMGCG